ncbi:MAG: aminotransferase class IV [Microthrixaceae bacterium]|nr:aminotransferase class IV [Microthrixaceae bacterium]
MPTESKNRHLVYFNGEVHEYSSLSDLPRPVAVSMGRELGISPVTYLNPSIGNSTISVWDHLDVLSESATLLGYAGATPARLAELLLEYGPLGGPDCTLVALVPDPTSHVAAPPGLNWFLHAEAFRPSGDSSTQRDTARGPLAKSHRTGISAHRRNHRDPSTRVQLWDDIIANLTKAEASQAGLDAMVVLNVDGRVASTGVCTVMLELGERYVTPPLSEGALDTPWRRNILYSGEAVEMRLTLENLRNADMVLCLSPWGEEYRLDLVETGDGAGDQRAE